MSNNNLNANEQPAEDYKLEEGVEAEEDENLLIEEDKDIFKLASVSYAVQFQRWYSKLSYDYFKQSMRWFLESATCNISFSVSVYFRFCRKCSYMVLV